MKKAILISGFGMVETRLLPIKQLIENEYSVEIYVSDFNHQAKKYKEGRLPDCQYIHVKPYTKNLSIDRIVSHYGFSREVYKILKERKPDLIYTRIPFNSLAKYCAKYKKRYNRSVKVLFDIIDLWPESMPQKGFLTYLPFQYWKGMRDNYLKYATHVFMECEFYHETLKEYLPANWSPLYLYKEESDSLKHQIENILACATFGDSTSITLCYLGSINHIIDLQGIKKVVALLSEKYKVKIKVVGDGESKEEFIDAMERAGGEVEYLGKIYDEEEKIRVLAPCDFGINMMVDTVSVGLTTKSIDYFEFGIPLINNIKGDTWGLIEANGGGGINVSDDLDFIKDVERVMRCPRMEHEKARGIYLNYLTKDSYQRAIEAAFCQIL